VGRITLFQHSNDAVEFKAGEVIFRKGDPAEHLHIVIDGEVQIEINGTVVGTVHPGEAFGEMALIDRVPRSATAIAKVDSHVVAIDKKRFLFMVSDTPNFALQIMGTMADRLRALNDRLVE
jgi:CRP/FNR family transcriptional regulator, cyclic AMP receptor protein